MWWSKPNLLKKQKIPEANGFNDFLFGEGGYKFLSGC